MVIRDPTREEMFEIIEKSSQFCDESSGYTVDYNEENRKAFRNQLIAALSSGMKTRVAEESDNIMGAIMYISSREDQITREKYGFILNLIVFPEYRKKGIARSLIENFKEELEKEGINDVRLNVFAENGKAIRLYEKLGFKIHSMVMSKKT